MATYKVLQDIEAEDKLVGPLTLRQFLYAIVTLTSGYFCFLGISKHIYVILPIFIPILLLFGFLAFPWGRDQPTEVWALAKIRYLMFPRVKTWDQSGRKELVTITAPKEVNPDYTDKLSQNEVRGRLSSLADTLDSRGWAVKNADINDPVRTNSLSQSDRLVNVSSLIPATQAADVSLKPSDDVLNTYNSQLGNSFSQMISSSEAKRHQNLLNMVQSASTAQPTPVTVAPTTVAPTQVSAPPPNVNTPNTQAPNQVSNSAPWFPPQPSGNQVVSPLSSGPADSNDLVDEDVLTKELKQHKQAAPTAHMHIPVIQPLSQASQNNQPSQAKQEDASPPPKEPANTIEYQPDNAKIEESRRAVEKIRLATNNDLDIATIARRSHSRDKKDDKEVVISLH